MGSERNKVHYKSTLSTKDRGFYHANKITTLIFGLSAGSLLMTVFVAALAYGEPEAGKAIPFYWVSGTIAAIFAGIGTSMWWKRRTLHNREANRIFNILETHFFGRLDEFDDDDLDNIVGDLLSYEVSSGILTAPFYLLNTVENVEYSISYKHDTNEYVIAAPIKNPAPKAVTISTNRDSTLTDDWFKVIKKNTPKELISSVTDLRQLIDTTNLSAATEEEKHTIQRILTDSVTAVELHQNAVSTSKSLPQYQQIQNEADTALRHTMHSLHNEAEKLVTKQAETAMGKLHAHVTYVDSSSK